VAEEPNNRDWKHLNIAVSDKVSGAVIEYKVHFYRKTDEWYDEVRYDGHEIKRGRKTLAPHLHLKLSTALKDPDKGEEELKQIIDRILPEIERITQ
jgi:hypothetical protein